MSSALRSALWVSVLALSSFAAADGFSLKRVPKVGDAIKYTMSVDLTANGTKGSITATLLEQVTKIDKDGNYSVQQTQIDAGYTFDGEKSDLPPRPPITLTYKPNRQVSAIAGTLIDANSYRVENLATLVDPGKPKNIGDIWNAEIPEDKTLGTPKAKFEYKLVEEQKIGDVDTLKITGSARETDGDNPPVHEFTMWISKTDGSLIQLESKWQNAPFPGISSPVTATIKMTRVAV